MNELLNGFEPEPRLCFGHIILLYKGKVETECPKNYRPITFLNTLYKLYTGVFNRRLTQSLVINNLWDANQQALINAKRGCLDAHLLSKAYVTHFLRFSKSKSMAATYLDFQKAYDSVDHEMHICTLKTFVYDDKIVRAIKTLMKNSTTRISTMKVLSDKQIRLSLGVFQGDAISPTFFCLVISLLKHTHINEPT